MANLRSVFNKLMLGRGGAYRSGAWIRPTPVPAGTFAYSQNAIYFIPINTGWRAKFQALSTDITIAGGAGSLIRLGVYADSGFAFPGKLLVDAGTLDGTVIGNGLTINIPAASRPTVPAGLNWLACVPQIAAVTPTQRIWAGSTFQAMYTSAVDANNLQVYAYSWLVGAVGALPPLVTWPVLSGGTSAPLCSAQFE